LQVASWLLQVAGGKLQLLQLLWQLVGFELGIGIFTFVVSWGTMGF